VEGAEKDRGASSEPILHQHQHQEEDEDEDPVPKESGPTDVFAVYGNEDYVHIMNGGADVPQSMVLGQSMPNGCHDSDSVLHGSAQGD
jgi:hypothetical protein